MRRMNNLVTLFTAIIAFFFGSFITTMLTSIDDKSCAVSKSGVAKMEPHPELFLVVLCLSAPNNIDRRQTMRDTWLRLGQPLQDPYYPEEYIYIPDYDRRGHLQTETVAEQSNRQRLHLDWLDALQESTNDNDETKKRRNIKVRHFFAVGISGMSAGLKAELQREHKLHRDMLLLPRLQDSYSNLTEKLLHSIEALTHHHDFSYLLKVDDDTYVKLDKIINELVSYDRKLMRKLSLGDYDQQHRPLPQLFWGYFNGRAAIKTKGQWKEPNYVLSARYITYALGGGYVITRQLCEHVANESRYLTPYISEDVSMGTWLAPLRHVFRRHDPRFDTGYMPRKCRKQHMVLHKRNQAVMRDLYAGKFCTFEVANEGQLRRPLEYYYDWRKTADKCCDSVVV